MGIDLRLPNISGNEREQLVQIRSYLYQLIPQLQFALNNVSTSNTQVVTTTPRSLLPSSNNGYGLSTITDDDNTAQATFNSIKSLIIKSADIVEAYYEEINKKLESIYVAQSDFGDYAEKTSQEIEATSTSTTQRFENIQIIITNHDSDIASLSGDLQSIGQDLSYTQNDILSIRGNVEGIESAVITLESNIGELDTNLKETTETLSKNITDAKT